MGNNNINIKEYLIEECKRRNMEKTIFEDKIKISFKYPATGYKDSIIKTIRYERYKRDVAIANLFLDPTEFGYVIVTNINLLESRPVKNLGEIK